MFCEQCCSESKIEAISLWNIKARKCLSKYILLEFLGYNFVVSRHEVNISDEFWNKQPEIEVLQGRVTKNLWINKEELNFSYWCCAHKDNIACFVQGGRSFNSDNEPVPDNAVGVSTDADCTLLGLTKLLRATGVSKHSNIRFPFPYSTHSPDTVLHLPSNPFLGRPCPLCALIHGWHHLQAAWSSTTASEDIVTSCLVILFPKCFVSQRKRSLDSSGNTSFIGILTRSWSRKLGVQFPKG